MSSYVLPKYDIVQAMLYQMFQVSLDPREDFKYARICCSMLIRHLCTVSILLKLVFSLPSYTFASFGNQSGGKLLRQGAILRTPPNMN